MKFTTKVMHMNQWDIRFQTEQFVYGKEANAVFLAGVIVLFSCLPYLIFCKNNDNLSFQSTDKKNS